MVGMVVVVVIVSTTVGPGGSIAPGVEGEGVDERLSTANTTLFLSSGCARHKDQQANLKRVDYYLLLFFLINYICINYGAITQWYLGNSNHD